MATSTHTLSPVGSLGGAMRRPAGFFDRVFQRFMAAQEARATRIVRQHLSALSDVQLSDLGYGAAEIKEIRAHAHDPISVWR